MPNSLGLVRSWSTDRRLCYIHQMNLVNPRSGSAMMTD